MIGWDDYTRWRAEFSSVMDPRMYSIGWLDGMVWSGRAKFIGNERGGAVAELRHYPTGTFDVHGLVAAGALEEIRDALIPAFEEWGRSIGAIGFVVESRDGWVRSLKRQGFEPYQSAVRKDFE